MATSSSPGWFSSLADTAIKADLINLTADGVLSEAAAVQILVDVANRGALTAAEFSSLQTIAANLNNGLSTSDYVASVFSQLVNGSPANAVWTGGAASPVPLGNLQVGSTSAQMNELIGKWFFGTDLPNPNSGTFAPAYVVSTLPLYGSTGAASVADISQGQLGDCELLACLIEQVINHPSQLASMIVNDGNGVYGVRFYVNGSEVWVTVNNALPTYNGSLVYNNAYASSSTLWADLVEKAYAQLSATGQIGHPAINSYQNISADAADNVLTNLTNCSSVTYYDSASSGWNSYRQLIIDDIANHYDVILETGPKSATIYDAAGKIELIADHAYAVIGYDGATGNFIVRNPWGTVSSSQIYDTQFEVSMAMIASVQGDFAVDNSINSIATVIVRAATAHEIVRNSSTPLAGLFTITNSTGAAITEYGFQLAGSGAIQLNGATNLATAAQTAQGQVVVSASDLPKIVLAAGATTGPADVFVSAYDGTNWSAAADVQLTISGNGAVVIPAFNPVLAANGSVSLSSLFSVSGSLAPGNTWYSFIVPSGGGVINLNGAQNFWTSTPGEYEVSAAQLAQVTYTAPSSPGSVTLQVEVFNGSGWSDWQNVDISVGISGASKAVQNFANGQLTGAAHVSDTAANIFSNLDGLQGVLSTTTLQSVSANDVTLQVQTIAGSQFAADKGVLSIVSGNFKLVVNGMAAADAAGLNTQLVNHLQSFTIIDSAANVSAKLDALEAFAVSGTLTKIYLTDPGTPTLNITPAQVTSDAAALRTISGAYATNAATPAITSITAATDNHSASVGAGHLVTVTVNLSAALTVIGTPTLQLNDNEAAIYSIGSGTNALTFVYMVQPGDSTPDLQVTGLNLPNGAGIIDGNGNSFSDSFARDLSIQINTSATAPTSVQQEVMGLYGALYGRAGEYPGYSFWVALVGSQPDSGGVTVANAGAHAITSADAGVLGKGFVVSQSTFFNTTYGAMSDSQFINAMYLNIGGKAGDPNGISYWSSQLASAEAQGQSTQASRAGLVGQFVDVLVGFDTSHRLSGLTDQQWTDALTRQETISNKIAVSLAYANASQQASGAILIPQAAGDAAYHAAILVLQGVTSDPHTVATALAGISNAVAHQDLSLI